MPIRGSKFKSSQCRHFLCRNIFGPVLGSSPAQNPPVLPSMQPGFGGDSTVMDSENKYSMVIYLLCNSPACVLSSCSVHKSLCCCSRCPRNDHQPFSDQWQSSSCRCVRPRFGTFHDFFFMSILYEPIAADCDFPEYLEFTPPCVCVCVFYFAYTHTACVL